MSHCAICEKLLTPEIDSREHIFPKSIGGKKTVSGFICIKCNSVAGNGWDAELARQLNPISLLLEMQRWDTQKPVPSQQFQSTAGDSYVRDVDGNLRLPKPTIREISDKNGKSLEIIARDKDELKRILIGLKKKHPEIDPAETMTRAVSVTQYPKDLLHIPIHFGGVVSGRSVVKTALAFAVASGIAATSCESACRYLRNSAALAQWDYYPDDPIENRPNGVPLHCVAVQGESGKLVAYVEYFGFRRIWIPLSDFYTGRDIRVSHAFDPVRHVELMVQIKALSLSAPSEHMTKVQKQTESELSAVLAPAHEEAKKRELNRVIRDAWDRTCEKLKIHPGDAITVEQQKEFAALLVKEVLPFFEHQMHNPFEGFKP